MELMEEGRVPWASWSLVTKCMHAQVDYCLRATKRIPQVTSPELYEETVALFPSRPLPAYLVTNTRIPKILYISAHYLANSGA